MHISYKPSTFQFKFNNLLNIHYAYNKYDIVSFSTCKIKSITTVLYCLGAKSKFPAICFIVVDNINNKTIKFFKPYHKNWIKDNYK